MFFSKKNNNNNNINEENTESVEKTENNNNSSKKQRKKFKDTINKKYLKNGSYSSIMIVVFAAIIIVINMIVGNLPSKYTQLDISSEKLYTIGDETKAMLKDLDKDVIIYQIAQSGSEDETISNLLQRYADESDHITVEQKDPVVNPKFISEYTSDNLSSNSLIIVCGDRNKVVNYNNIYESSLDYNTLEGHGEQDLDSTVKEDIEKANMEIKSLNLLTEGSVPEDASCLLIDAPTTDISEDEKTALIEYLENGGKAMIFSDYTGQEMPNFDAVLENYGVNRVDGLVFEGDSQHYAAQMPYYLVPTINSTDITSDLVSSGYYILMPYAQGIQKSEDVRDTVTIESLLTTSDSAYSKTDVNSGTLSKEDGDVDGPFDLGVSITETVDTDKETHIIYYSTSNLLQSQVNQMVSGGNEKLVMASLSALVDTEDSTTVSIPSKSLEVSYLTLTAYDASFWKICVIGLIPGAFLLVGFMIWLKRRKA